MTKNPRNSIDVEEEVNILVRTLHGGPALRVWSVLITVFGDSVVPRGGEIWLGTLLEIAARMSIEPGAVRAAMSRLTSDGWLVRERKGRNSYYRLAKDSEAAFSAASRRIYSSTGQSDWDGSWRIAVLKTVERDRRDEIRKTLIGDGFGVISPTVLARPETGFWPVLDSSPDFMLFHAENLSELSEDVLSTISWPTLASAETGYRTVLERFTPLREGLRAGATIAPLSAMAARTLLIHDFRRAVLHDPMLPNVFHVDGWCGLEARVFVGELYEALKSPSEVWLDDRGVTRDGTIPAPDSSFASRFGNSWFYVTKNP